MLSHHLCIILIPLMSCLAAAVDFPAELGGTSALTGDRYIFVGATLNLTCSPAEKYLENFNVSNTSFSFIKQFLPRSQAECLPMSFVHVNENQQSATLVIHNVTVDNDGQYTCHIGSNYCWKEDIHQLTMVDADDIHVEYPPHNVSQFICVVYNWNDFMNCTWQHPVNYIDLSNINISAGYTVSSKKHQVSAFRCPHLSYHGCMFNSSDFFLVENYVIEVNVTNIVKDITASRNFHVNTFKVVKPAPVVKLSSGTAQAQPGCISLSWEHPKIYEKVYRVRHQQVGGSQFEVVDENIRNTNVTYCGYHAYTHHNYSVDCYPAGIYSGNWSDPVYIDVWTSMTAPNVGPRTINGSYTSTKCVNGNRNVTLMWQEVEESDRNGIIDGYFIKQGEKYLRNVSSDAHLATVELVCGSLSELTIVAYNKEGNSVNPTVMVIAPDTFTVPRSTIESFMVEISQNASLCAVWNVTDGTKHLNYTIFWCLGLPGQPCEGPINWSEVPGTQMHYDFPVLDAEAQKYLFGISKRDTETGRATEIFWTGCLFRHDPPLVGSVDKMYVESGTESVRVAWNPVRCSYQNQVKVTSYTVKWHEVSHGNATDRVFSADVPASESSYMVSPLTANTNYKFTVQAVADGHPGEEVQPWKIASPSAAAGQNLLWLWFLILPGAFLFVFFWWKCVTRQKHFQEMTGNQFINFTPVDQLNASPHRSPTIPADRLTGKTVGATTEQLQSTLVICDQGIPGKATSATTSGDSFADDPSNNSRSRLIKQTAEKETRRWHLPRVPESVAFQDVYVPDGGASVLKRSSQESEPAGVYGSVVPAESSDYMRQYGSSTSSDKMPADKSSNENEWSSASSTSGDKIPAEKSSYENGWSSTSLTTGTESVQPYVQLTDVEAGQKDVCMQDCAGTHIPGQFNHPHSDHIVLCVKQDNEAARMNESISAEEYSNMAVEDLNIYCEIQETLNPNDTVTSVEPSAPSVLGAQSGGVDLGNSDNERTSTDLTFSDISVEFHVSTNSGQSSSHSSSGAPPCSNGYIPLTEV